MKFTYDPDVESFRGEVRKFIADNLPPEEVRLKRGYEGGFKTRQEEYDYTMGFQKKLSEKGWLAMAWPKEYGGGGASHMRQLVYNEEMAYHGAPSGNMGIAWVGPSLMLYGTEEQKSRFIPRITGADDWWCTLYSEPGAGSDLAALQTRAVKDGDDYVINGQKIWTTGAQFADMMYMLVRTDPDAPKHRGITYLLVNMKSPGVTVRPLTMLSGAQGFNEVFFEDVRVPVKNRIGEENRGWYVGTTTLDFERSSIGSAVGVRKQLEGLIRLAKSNPEASLERPAVKREFVDRWIEAEVAKMLSYRVVSMQANGKIPNHEASMCKLFSSELSQRIANLSMHMHGMHGNLRNRAGMGYMQAVSSTIAGGTTEVQKGIIATRGLGLPRG